MKTKKMLIALATVVACTSAYATGSDDGDWCRKTTSRCGTVIIKPSDGYGGQCGGKLRRYLRKYVRRCGGCGKLMVYKQSDN